MQWGRKLSISTGRGRRACAAAASPRVPPPGRSLSRGPRSRGVGAGSPVWGWVVLAAVGERVLRPPQAVATGAGKRGAYPLVLAGRLADREEAPGVVGVVMHLAGRARETPGVPLGPGAGRDQPPRWSCRPPPLTRPGPPALRRPGPPAASGERPPVAEARGGV